MCNRFLHLAPRGYIPRGLGSLLHRRLHHPAAAPAGTGRSLCGHWFWAILSTRGLCSRVLAQRRLHLSQRFPSQRLLSPPGPQLHLKKSMSQELELDSPDHSGTSDLASPTTHF